MRLAPKKISLLATAGLLVAAAAVPVSAQQRFGFEGVPDRPAPAGVGGPFFGDAPRSEFEDRAIITSEGDILTEGTGSIAFAPSRTRIQYNDITIEADRMVIDFVSEDVQAEGNVLFTSETDFIRADSGRFNIGRQEGIAFGVEGQSGDLFFKIVQDEEKRGSGFRQINAQESVFQGARFTFNDFPVPMWYVRASEVIFIRNERVFFRNARLYVRGTPVFWMPFYTRNLRTGSPWSVEVGFDSQLGAYLRLGYRYRHFVRVPGFDENETPTERSEGLLDVYADWMSMRGIGAGARYQYQFDFRRHTGFIEVYGVRDTDRRIDADPINGISEDRDGEVNRWVYRHQHNSIFMNSLIMQWNADLASDPDVYVDFLDRFSVSGTQRRGRLFEQRLRASAAYRWDAAVGRVMLDRKERLGRDRVVDYSDPFADDLDFDPAPNFEEGVRFRGNGISGDRYGLVSENVSARYSTRLLRLGTAPLYYRFEANAFSSLDSGFNTLNDSDDARVQGLDLYNSVTNRLRIGPRTTWTNTLGVGAALYDRDTSDAFSARDFGRGILEPDETRRIDGMRARDRGLFFLGNSETERSFDEVDSYYLFADYESRLNHRFTDFLDGYLRYFNRRGTDNSLGEFYESIGRVEAAGDIYDFYTDRHFVEAGMNYFLRFPNIIARAQAGQNLDSDEDLFANEQIRYLRLMTDYFGPTGEFAASTGFDFQTRQIRDRGDSNSFEQDSISPFLRLAYLPRHARYWASLNVFGTYVFDDDPVLRDDRQRLRFDENDPEFFISPLVGRRFGPKYRAQIGATYNTRSETIDRAGITIIRDLKDAELGLFLGVRNNSFENRRNDESTRSLSARRREADFETDIRVGFRLRISPENPGLGSRSITTLSDLQQEPQFVQ